MFYFLNFYLVSVYFQTISAGGGFSSDQHYGAPAAAPHAGHPYPRDPPFDDGASKRRRSYKGNWAGYASGGGTAHPFILLKPLHKMLLGLFEIHSCVQV